MHPISCLAGGVAFGSTVVECAPKQKMKKPSQQMEHPKKVVPHELDPDASVNAMRQAFTKLDIPVAHSVSRWDNAKQRTRWKSIPKDEGITIYNRRCAHMRGFNESLAWLQQNPLPQGSAVGFCSYVSECVYIRCIRRSIYPTPRKGCACGTCAYSCTYALRHATSHHATAATPRPPRHDAAPRIRGPF